MPQSADDILELIDRAKIGDAAALDRLLERYRPYLRIVAQNHLGPLLLQRIDAADLVQQTEHEAAQGIRGFRGVTENEFSAWIQQMLRRNISDAERYHFAQERDPRRERPIDDTSPTMSLTWLQPATKDASPSRCVMDGEAALRLASALATLPHEEQLAVQMRFMQGCKLREIATTLNMSSGGVARLLDRGLRKLKEQLGRESHNL